MTRRYELDWIRIYAFLLLVLYHVGMYYVTWDWHIKSPFASDALEPLMLASAPWRLSLLFLVSGVAAAHLLAKQAGSFAGARSRRLLIPLLFGMLVIVPPQSYFEVVEKLPGGYHDGYLAFWGRYLMADDTFCRDGDCLAVPTWNHLWFVAYLWCYCMALAILAAVLSARSKSALLAGGSALFAGARLLWLPVILLGLTRIVLFDMFGSTHGLVDDWYNHAQYGLVFLLGLLFAHNGSVWPRLERARWWMLGLAIATYTGLVTYFSLAGDDPPSALRMFMRVVWSAFQWWAIAAILGFAQRWRARDSAARRYLTEAVFPVYILHQTLIILIAMALRPLGWTPMFEGPLLALATLALSFALFETIRRVKWLRPLFGLTVTRGTIAGPSRRETATA